MKKKVIVAVIYCVCIIPMEAQEYVIPPSPESSALCQIAETPVNLSNGGAEIDIPLYEIKCKGLSMPISLNYNTQGHRVNSIASWVGLGWTLNAGGLISRSVVGLPDDGSPFNYADLETNVHVETGFLNNYVGKVLEKGTSITLDTINKYIDNQFDTEQDIFYYNFNGIAGSFVFDANSNVRKLDYNNILFKVSKDPQYSNITSFTATTEDGTQYFFNQIELSTILILTKIPGNPIPAFQVYVYNSSWYLTKIKTIYNEEINFSYTKQSAIIDPLPLYVYARYTQKNDCTDAMSPSSGNLVQTPYLLNGITTPNSTIAFSVSSRKREDYIGFTDGTYRAYANGNSLGNITINDVNGNLIKGFNFDYSNFVQAGQTDAIFKRLKLNSIQEVGAGQVSKPPYIFTYDESNVLPHFFSAEQDLWGFYNGSGATTLIPQLYVYPDLSGSERFRIFPKSNYTGTNSFLISTGADRRPNENKMKACILNQIQYPTGGTRTFEFESHRCMYDGDLITGGGLRIKSITDYDGINHAKDIVRSYLYNYFDTNQPSGKLLNMPTYAYTDNSSYNYRDGTHIDLAKINYDFDSQDYYKYFLKRFSIDQSSLGIQGGSNIIYNEVICQTSQIGYTVNRYSIPALYNEDNDCSIQGGSSCNCDPTYSGNCDNLYSTSKTIAFYHSDAYVNKMDITKNTFPFSPNLNYAWNRGFLISSKVYDQNKKPLKETDYQYTIFNGNNYSSSLKFGVINYMPIRGGAQGDFVAVSVYKYIVDAKKILSTQKEIVFDPKDQSKFTTLTTNYLYNNYAQPNSTSQTQSNGSTLTTNHKYVSDYLINSSTYVKCNSALSSCKASAMSSYQYCMHSGSGTNCDETYRLAILQCDADYNSCLPSQYPDATTISKMQNRNMIAYPVESQNLVDGKLISGNLIKYGDFGDDILAPKITYALQTAIPLINTSMSSFDSNNNFTYNTSYQQEAINDRYDSKGNILQNHKTNDVNTSYIWGYNQTLPIAKAINAGINEIYFTSFEDQPQVQGGFPFIFDQTRSKAGNYSLLSTNTSGGENYYFSSFLDISNSAPKKYKYSVWAYSDAPSVELFFFMKPNRDNDFYSSGWQAFPVSTSETNKWVLLEGEVAVPSNMQRIYLRVDNNGGGKVWFDDLRLYPSDAQMTTYTYKPLVGMTSQTNEKNITTYYEFDSLGRLHLVKDQDGNIVKTYDYHYKE